MRILKYTFLIALLVFGIGGLLSILNFRETGFQILMVGGFVMGGSAALFLMCASILGRTRWDDFEN